LSYSIGYLLILPEEGIYGCVLLGVIETPVSSEWITDDKGRKKENKLSTGL